MTQNNESILRDKTIPARRPWPSRLFVETTTRCNLRCRMCVKESWDRSVMEGDMADETFTALESVFPHLEVLILNGVGEPLLDPRLEDFIRRAKALMPAGSWVGFQSNGMLLDGQRAVALVAAGIDRICLSADALDPETFREIRRGGEEQGIEQAFAFLHKAKELCNRPDVKVGLEFVLMRDNIRELPELLRRAVDLGASFAVVTHVLPYAENSIALTAFESNMNGAVALFAEWRAKAQQEGLDISGYFKVLWKYMRKPTEQELAAFLAELAIVAGEPGGMDRIPEIIGSSLPSKQITIKSFADTRSQIEQLFGDDEGMRSAFDQILAVLAGKGHQAGRAESWAEHLVSSWSQKSTNSELCLADYLTVFWKYSRTPREQRLFDLVEEMKAEARSRGISLHLRNLMERDEVWADEVAQVFFEARAVAEEAGLDIVLPGAAPDSNRRCDFIENGGAFVSWNGNVHPCYFLWHQYGCHLFGRKKNVTSKVFGNVRESGILEVWNCQAFRDFREEVLTYDFPYCSNCNVVPCQYLTADEFEQDCYGNTVPCGDCFWCMGMFHCLQ